MTDSYDTTSVVYATIPGLSRYQIGDDGSVWTNRNCRGNLCEWKRISGTITKAGYVRTMLSTDENGMRMFMVHCLILEAFISPRPSGMECCHRDDIKTNNVLSNLRWDTAKENQQDRVRNGLKTSHLGILNGRATVTEEIVRQVRQRIAEGVAGARVRDEFNLTENTFQKIKHRVTWKHIA